MLKRILLAVGFFVMMFGNVFAQKESNHWYFGKNAGLHFSNNSVLPDTNGKLYSYLSQSAISDANGNLLFYTNGDTVWNKNHQIMQNGIKISANTNYADNSEVSVIVPLPKDKNVYYIFSINVLSSITPTLFYSVVDLSYNNGYGKVVSKNNILLTNMTYKLTAVHHANKESIWLITHGFGTNSFYSYLINKNGINLIPVTSNTGSVHSGFLTAGKVGNIKVSPQGDKLVSLKYSTNQGDPINFEVFDFNNRTGLVSDPVSTIIFGPYYAEFSPNGRFLYITRGGPSAIDQYDLNYLDSSNFFSSRIIIDTLMYQSQLQLANNGKIYVARYNKDFLGVVNNPNEKGANCNYVDSGQYIGTRKSLKGLPFFLQSYFFKPDFEAVGTCFGDSTHFYLQDSAYVDSLFWVFDDSLSGANNFSTSWAPVHYFSDTGIFNVQMIVYHDSMADTSMREIRISPYPSADFSINDNAQCLSSNNFVFTNTTSIASGACSYEWWFGDSTLSYDTNATHIYLQEDSFDVRMFALSDYGCLDSTSKKVYVFPPKAAFTVNDTGQCHLDNSFQFINQTTNNFGTIDYTWHFGDGDSSILADTVFHSYALADSFQVTLIANSNFGCSDTLTKEMVVFPMPEADFNINDSVQCFNEQMLVARNSSFVSRDSIIENKWVLGNKAIVTKDLTNYAFDSSGVYQVQLIVTTANNCRDTIEKQIEILTSPVAGFSINDSSQCFNTQLFMVQNTSLITGDSIVENLWYIDNDTIRTKDISNFLFDEFGIYPIKLVVNALNGCKDSLTEVVEIYEAPKATLVSMILYNVSMSRC
jgi:hypothetical protein